MKIIYPTASGVAVVTPTGELPIEEVARKDVPAGVPYRIIEDNLVPTDRTFRDAWEADFVTPDGVGIGAAAWFAEQAAVRAQAESEAQQRLAVDAAKHAQARANAVPSNAGVEIAQEGEQ
jgi:hypothetical protein